MKRIKILFIIMFCFLLSGCDESFEKKESYDFYPIDGDINNTSDFMDYIKEYANTFENNLMLGDVQLIYSDKYDLKVIFTFTKRLSETESSSLFLHYDPNKKGIVYSEYITGSAKVFSPFNNELDITNWRISFNQGLDELQKQLDEKGISSFKSISCHCYEDKWVYSVIFSNDYQDRIEITISPLK